MSLILDALRKSEAERRRGQVPGLHSPAPLLARAPARRRPIWPWLVVLLLVVAGAIATWFARSNAPAPALRGSAEIPATSPIANTPHAPVATSSAMPSSTVAPLPAPPLLARVRAEPAITSITSAPLKLPAAQRDAPPVSASPSSPAPQTAAAPQEPALPTLAALAADQRGSLPPLKMSMHVWAEQPGGRFAIIDGQRVGEGASLSGAVVAGIRRDGVVLEIDGRLYLLPRP